MSKYLDLIASFGCIICQGPAEIHHPRFVCGMSQRANEYLAIPLCPAHHRQGNYGQAIHNGQQEFEANFGSEQELLAKTIERVWKRR